MIAPADRQAHFLLRSVGKAIRTYDMIRCGDRVAVAVSGGKDSLALLDLLDRYRRVGGVSYDLCAIHVCGNSLGATPVHAALAEWLDGRGLPYRITTPEPGERDAPPIGCQRCTWLRRKALFEAAEVLGCNVVALGHHADDVAQTVMLNLLYVGGVHSLAPAASYLRERFRLVRPLILTPESEIARFARACSFPAPPPACPGEKDSRRSKVKEMLRLLGPDYLLQVRANLLRVGLSGHESAGLPGRPD